MQHSNFSLLLALCMSLFVSAALADDISVPDKSHRQGMSYEEYAKYREKMRMQMEQSKIDKVKQAPDASNSTTDQDDKPSRDSAYGQGYHSRNPPVERPRSEAGSRPERSRPERFNRGDMGRR